PRPRQARRRLVDGAAARGRRHDRAAHDAIPRGGRRPRPRDHRDRPWAGHRPRHSSGPQVAARRADPRGAPRGRRPAAARDRAAGGGRHPRTRASVRRPGFRARRRRRRPRAHRRPPRRGRHRRDRARAAVAEPRRGLLRPHRPRRDHRRSPRNGRSGRLMDAVILARRTVTKMVRNPEQFIDVTLQPVLMTVIFVFIFGGAIAGGTEQYLLFTLPAIIVQTIMFTSMTIGVNLNTDLKNGVFDRFRSLPISRSAPLIGAVLGDIVRHAIAVGVSLAFGALIGFRFHTSALEVLLAIALMIVFAVSLCWI